jgi:ankyrin repeat protein
MERKKRRLLAERRIFLLPDSQENDNDVSFKRQKIVHLKEELLSWEPSPEDMEAWDKTVMQILAEIESKASKMENGLDRNGAESTSYRNSLPEFLQAAADGDLQRLMEMVQTCGSNVPMIRDLIDTRDRHGSLAVHWAAGGGHLDCLKYLLALRKRSIDKNPESASSTTNETISTKKLRRRDGKTCLHYAARNGHCHCIKFLVDDQKMNVNEPSGDGTTPFHLACFGGNLSAVKLLVEKAANVHAVNEWGCNAAHWIGMTKKHDDDEQVKELCRFLQEKGVSFTEIQKQGHSALHKAAQRLNKHVIEWMGESAANGGAGLTTEERNSAARPDEGGHTARDIWRSMGGDDVFAKRMEQWDF